MLKMIVVFVPIFADLYLIYICLWYSNLSIVKGMFCGGFWNFSFATNQSINSFVYGPETIINQSFSRS